MTDHADTKLPIIGYDLQLIQALAKAIEKAVEGERTNLYQSRRGYYFDVALADSRFARVTVELDRVDPDLAAKIAEERLAR